MAEVKAEDRRIKAIEEWEAKKPVFEAIERKKEEDRRAKIELIKAEYLRLQPVLSSKPHPNFYFSKKGKTMLDYLNYFLGADDQFRHYDNNKVIDILREQGAKI